MMFGQNSVGDGLQLCCGEASSDVCLLEQGDVIWYGRLGKGALNDDVCSGCEGIEKGTWRTSTLKRSDLPELCDWHG